MFLNKKSVMFKIVYCVFLVLMIVYFIGKIIMLWIIYCKLICKYYDYFLFELVFYYNKILFVENKILLCLN